MNIYLLRHAEAEVLETTDDARALTPKGVKQAQRAGHFCAQHRVAPEIVLHSPFKRTAQTARLFHEALARVEVTLQEAPFLASGMEPEVALVELRAYNRFDGVMLVGHQPDIGLLAAALLGVPGADHLAVGKASLMCIEMDRLVRGGGVLQFFVPSALM